MKMLVVMVCFNLGQMYYLQYVYFKYVNTNTVYMTVSLSFEVVWKIVL